MDVTTRGEQCIFRVKRGSCNEGWTFDSHGRLQLLKLTVQPFTGPYVGAVGVTQQSAPIRLLRIRCRRRALERLRVQSVHLLEALSVRNVRGTPRLAQQPRMFSTKLHPSLPTAQGPSHESGTAGAQSSNDRAEQRGQSRIHNPAA
ncbi:hypothetical protein ACIF8T_39545 [Streptomyces sp. NPDC085946]|uniref:hypothetical protein n=1 Tax=Streptomyces sp. NPDC085946 TaxID=3365744 RepID=UPI0037D67DAC